MWEIVSLPNAKEASAGADTGGADDTAAAAAGADAPDSIELCLD